MIIDPVKNNGSETFSEFESLLKIFEWASELGLKYVTE